MKVVKKLGNFGGYEQFLFETDEGEKVAFYRYGERDWAASGNATYNSEFYMQHEFDGGNGIDTLCENAYSDWCEGGELDNSVGPLFDDDVKSINDRGGKQTHLPVRTDLLPPTVLLDVAKVLADGAEKYGEHNWKSISVDDHLNHLVTHVYRFLSGDRSEPHLIHAICRAMFAAHVEKFGEDQ